MAKRRYRRYRRKGKWNPNIASINSTGDAPNSQRFGDFITISKNPEQTATNVSQTYTVKNVEVTGQLEAISSSVSSAIEDISYYIMFVPEGYTLDINLPFLHPEWILAYKFIGQTYGNASTSTQQPPRIRSRLARNLKSGDQIVFLYNGLNASTTDIPVKFQGLIRWWTKAN